MMVGAIRVNHNRRRMMIAVGGALVLLLILVVAPMGLSPATTSAWIKLIYLIALATAWNLLAGYAGMVSVGQQAYIGLGAYGVFVVNDWGVNPYLSAVIAAVIVGALALPISVVAFRLRGGYFAIGTWVIAEAARQIVVRFESLGAGRGRSLTTYTEDPTLRNLFTYWLALGVAAVIIAMTVRLLRSRTGVALQAIRDNEVAARALGIRVNTTKRIVFVCAALAAALVGAVICLQAIGVASPGQIFGVNYSAFMIFMVLIGGIGTVEGPVLGAVIYFVMDLYFSQLGLWYLVVLGLLAILVTLFLPKGIWGEISARFSLTLFPISRHVEIPADDGDLATP